MRIQVTAIAGVLPQALFPLRFGTDSRKLQASLKSHGLLRPLVLYRKDARMHVLDGMERLTFLKEQGDKNLETYVHDESNMDMRVAFLLYLEINHWHRPFNIVEKARALQTAHDLFRGEGIPQAFWDLAGVRQNIRVTQQYRDFLKLPDVLHKFAVNNNMPLATMLLFLRFHPSEIEAMASRLCRLPLNPNRLTEILSLLVDLTRRDELRALEVLDEILPRVEMESTPVQKEQTLRSVLLRKRNPNYEKRLREFEAAVKRLKLDDKIRVTPSPYFEEACVDVNTRFTSMEDVRALMETLEKEAWRDVFAAIK